MTRIVCDICGKDMMPSIVPADIRNMDFKISSFGKIWDICPQCKEDFKKWMKARKGDDQK